MGRPRQNIDALQSGDTTAAITPTPCEAKFLDLYFEHGNIAQAAIDSKLYRPRGGAIYRPNAYRAGSVVLEKFKPEVKKMMEMNGLSFVQLLAKLNAGLNAEGAYVFKRGKDEQVVTYPDHRSRAKFLEMAFKLLAAFPSAPAVVHNKIDSTNTTQIAVQHFESLKALSPEERDKRFAEMVEAAKRGPVRITR